LYRRKITSATTARITFKISGEEINKKCPVKGLLVIVEDVGISIGFRVMYREFK
jgi:hypothetical protein